MKGLVQLEGADPDSTYKQGFMGAREDPIAGLWELSVVRSLSARLGEVLNGDGNFAPS